MHKKQMSLQIEPTGGPLGAIVTGIDLATPVAPEDQSRLMVAWRHHLLLIFPGQNLTQSQHLAAAKLFGEPVVSGNKAYFERTGTSEFMVAEHPEISVVHNIGEEGRVVRRNNALGSDEIDWHSDNSYLDNPPLGSMLYGKTIPDLGGDTGQLHLPPRQKAQQ